MTAELNRNELTERRQCYCSWKLWIKIWQTCWNHFHAWMNVEEVNGDSWRRIKDFSSKVEAGARVLIGQKPQNCRADWRNIGFGKLSRNDGWVFEHIFSCSQYLFSGLQPPVSHYSNCDDTLFVFDLHAQTNNYINLYKLTKWTVISNFKISVYCVVTTQWHIRLHFKKNSLL